MSDRAVSEVVSYVLVFALITSAVGVVSVSGFAALQDTRNAEQINNAERAFDVLSDNLADIYKRDAPGRATELNLAGASLSTGGNVSVEVSVTQGGTTTDYGPWLIRPLIYGGEDDRQLGYEAGAVMRTNPDGGLVVEDPPWVLADDRVLISVVGLNRPSIQSVSGSTALVRADSENSTIENPGTTNNVDSVNITIRNTQNADEWEAYFDSVDGINTGSDCNRTDTAIGCDFNPGTTIDQVYVVHHDIFISIDP